MRTIADSYKGEGINKGIDIGKNEDATTKDIEIARRILQKT